MQIKYGLIRKSYEWTIRWNRTIEKRKLVNQKWEL